MKANVDAIDRVHQYVKDMTEQSFLQDEKTQEAVIRNFDHCPIRDANAMHP